MHAAASAAVDALELPKSLTCLRCFKTLQGGYLDMSAFIAEQGFKTGKGGYQKVRTRVTQRTADAPQILPRKPHPSDIVHPLKLVRPQDYPPLYVLRPDGSTLYTYRDVVYSFKKAASADLVLNIICSEQDLAQQKVALAMAMLNPAMTGRQYHVSYDLVRLPSGRMSGRRGRYLLADDLYDELKARCTHLARAVSFPFPLFHPLLSSSASAARTTSDRP